MEGKHLTQRRGKAVSKWRYFKLSGILLKIDGKQESSNPFSFSHMDQNSFLSALTHPRAGLFLLCQPNMSAVVLGHSGLYALVTTGSFCSATGSLWSTSLWFPIAGAAEVCVLLEKSRPTGRRKGSLH